MPTAALALFITKLSAMFAYIGTKTTSSARFCVAFDQADFLEQSADRALTC